MLVSTNLSSLSAQRMLFENNKAASTAMERLATGSKINKAQDDVAGFAIADRMTSQVRGLNMAVKNVNDAMAMLSVADSAASEITNMLQRMRELAIQAASDTNSAADRQYLQDEVNSLIQEIDRVANQTQYNDENLLDGSKSASFQVGASSGQTVGFDFASLSVGSLPDISSASSIDPSSARATVESGKLPNDLTTDQGSKKNE
jgi:flagellin